MATKSARDRSGRPSSQATLPPARLRRPPAPGLPGPEVFPKLKELKLLGDPLGLMVRMHDEYGDVFVLPFGSAIKHDAWVCSPALAQQVMHAPAHELEAADANAILEPLVGGSSLLLLRGRDHARRRELLRPVFDAAHLALDEKVVEQVAEAHLAKVKPGDTLPLWKWVRRLTIEIMMRVVFGVERGPSFDALADGINRVVELNGTKSMLALGGLRLGPFGPRARFVKCREQVDALIYREIEARRGDPRLQQREDILSLALKAEYPNGETLTDADVRDEVMTLVVAGNQTTAGAVAWAVELLLRNRPKLDALRRDLDGGHEDYLKAVIWESLRLRVPLFAIGRRALVPYRLGRFTIPAGMGIVVPLLFVYRSPEMFPNDPTLFRPERYLEGEAWPPWVPFGAGIRRCIGREFAYLQARVILRAMFEQLDFRLEDTSAERIELMSGALVVPHREVPLRVYAQQAPPASA
ncbi:MAG TPA: cytochrome P450 [Solirubrobacteraceae bacterium]|nr:cytochrome P450 [Solirubrobacteraceae bacterium]